MKIDLKTVSVGGSAAAFIALGITLGVALTGGSSASPAPRQTIQPVAATPTSTIPVSHTLTTAAVVPPSKQASATTGVAVSNPTNPPDVITTAPADGQPGTVVVENPPSEANGPAQSYTPPPGSVLTVPAPPPTRANG